MSPMIHKGWGLGVTIAMPRRVLGGHRYRWDLSEIHASPGAMSRRPVLDQKILTVSRA